MRTFILKNKLWMLLILGVFIVLYIWTRVALFQSKELLGLDTSISYLCGTGTIGDYTYAENEEITNKWIAIGELKERFLTVKAPVSELGKLQSKFDIHPPLYFAMLHVFFSTFGVTRFAYLLLNLILEFGLFFGLFLILKDFKINWLISFLFILLLAINPIYSASFENARMYHLLTLLAIWLHLMVSETILIKHIKWRFLLSIIITSALFLTHYWGWMFIAIYLFFHFFKKDYKLKKSFQFVLIVLVAFALSYLIFPHFFMQLTKKDTLDYQLSFIDLAYSLIHSYVKVLLPISVPTYFGFRFSLIIMSAAIVYIIYYPYNKIIEQLKMGKPLFLIGIAFVLSITLMLFLNKLPIHVLSNGRYYILHFTFIYLGLLTTTNKAWQKYLILFVLLHNSQQFRYHLNQNNKPFQTANNRYVLAGTLRGITPAIIETLPENAYLYIATDFNQEVLKEIEEHKAQLLLNRRKKSLFLEFAHHYKLNLDSIYNMPNNRDIYSYEFNKLR